MHDDPLAMDVGDDNELLILHSTLEKLLFNISHKMKNSLSTATRSSTADSMEVKLPNLDVHKQFWEQSTAKKSSSCSMQHAARNAIEGLSHSGDNYDEAVKCLKARYDWLRLIHCYRWLLTLNH